MRPFIPRSEAVDSAFRLLGRRIDGVRKGINAAAAKEMKVGKYEDAQGWMEIGRSVGDFAGRVEAFTQEWKRLVKAARILGRERANAEADKPSAHAGKKRTPTWRFCEPALRALAGRGGTAALNEIVADLEKSIGASLTEFDRAATGSTGTQRWHMEVQRSYRECQRQGWIEKQKRRDGLWKITPKGRAIGGEKA